MKIFSKKLTKIDVACILSMKSRALPYLPSFRGGLHAFPLTLEDEEGRRLLFNFRIHQDKYKEPELSTSWLDFVRSKKLKTGYEIHSFKEKDEVIGVMRYMIKAMTEVKLFGVIIDDVPYAD